MTDEPEITPAPLISVETEELLDATKKILETVVGTKNFDAGFDYINELYTQAETDAKAISIMLAGMEKNWDKSLYEGQSFLQVATRKTRFTIETIKRHMVIQELLDSDKIPEQFRPQIESGNQNALERVANALKEGFEFTVPEWQAVSEKITEEKETGKVVRKITGVEPRKNLLMVLIDERGVLWAWTKEEGLVEGGRLDVHSESPAVKKMVARITGCAGIKPREEF